MAKADPWFNKNATVIDRRYRKRDDDPKFATFSNETDRDELKDSPETRVVSVVRITAIAAGLICLAPTLAHPKPPHPVSARIHPIKWPQDGESDDVVGDVQVTLSDKTKETWTTDGHCELPKVSHSGLVGWTYAAGRHSRGAWMNRELRISRRKKLLISFDADYAFIEDWIFTDHNTCVLCRSRNSHGPSSIEKFSIKTGEIVDGCSGTGDRDTIPKWAWPLVVDDE